VTPYNELFDRFQFQARTISRRGRRNKVGFFRGISSKDDHARHAVKSARFPLDAGVEAADRRSRRPLIKPYGTYRERKHESANYRAKSIKKPTIVSDKVFPIVIS
jgi:hypothetical protein